MKHEKRDQEIPFSPGGELDPSEAPDGVDRRTFMMRSGVIGAAAVIAGCAPPDKEQAASTPAAPPTAPPKPASQMSPDLQAL